VSFETQTVSPVTQFDAHELTTPGVGMVSAETVAPSRMSRCTPVLPVPMVSQFPFGTYAVTPSGETSVAIEPDGNPQDAMAACDRQVPCAHVDPAAHLLPHAPQLALSERVATHTPLQSVWCGAHDVAPVVHVPALHTSSDPQAVPSVALGLEQVPVDGSQVPAMWQASAAAQVTGLAPTHLPALQASLWVHAFASLHDVPSLAAGFEHAPVEGLQDPAVWH
jgi:hypothetical protein